MHGSGRSQGWLIHLMAGAALGAVIVLVIWIFSGGRPFGEVVGTTDVSSPTRPAAVSAGASTVAAPALRARPPALKGSSSGSIRFLEPTAKRKAKAERAVKAKAKTKAKAKARAKRKRRGPVVRVVAPPSAEQPSGETPTAVVPSPAPSAAPAPAAPPAGGGGGGAAKPKSPGPTLWAGEG